MSATVELPKHRDLVFSGSVTQESIATLCKQIIEINAHDKTLGTIYESVGANYSPKAINIFIDTYGGDAYACAGAMSLIGSSVTPVNTIVTGAAMSAGFLILISGHKRYAHKLSTMMYHQVASGLYGKLKDQEEDIEESKRIQEMIDNMVVKNTKITKKKLKEVYDKKFDWFMSSKEALSLGVIDEII